MTQILDRLSLSAPVTATWEVTQACNLDCRHCLSDFSRADARDLSTEEALGVVDRLAEIGVFQLNIGGGEPLTRTDIWTLFEKAIRRDLLVCVSTNGTLVCERTADRFAALGEVAVQVSLDGVSAKTNDDLRGRGTHAAAVRAAQLLASAGVRTAFNVVVTRQNLQELDGLLGLAQEVGVDLRLSRLRPAGRGALVYREMQLDDSGFDVLKSWLLAHPGVRTGDSFFFLFEKAEEWASSSPPAHGLDLCGAGRFTMCIDPVGDVYPCAFLSGDEWRLGNILRDDFASMWGDSPIARRVREQPSRSCLLCGEVGCSRPCPGQRKGVDRPEMVGGDEVSEGPLLAHLCH